jgi:hypothetical protein
MKAFDCSLHEVWEMAHLFAVKMFQRVACRISLIGVDGKKLL